MSKIRDVIELFECSVQINDGNSFWIDIDGSNKSVFLSNDLLDEEVAYVECQKDKAIINVKG